MPRNKEPSEEPVESGDEWEVEDVIGHKVFFEQGESLTKFTVKWKDFPDSDNTDEPIENISNGAQSVLEKYMKSQEKLGVRFYKDGTKERKMKDYTMIDPARAAKKRKSESVKEVPESKEEKTKRKKRDSVISVDEEEEKERPSKKKSRKDVLKEASPPPQSAPRPKASASKPKVDTSTPAPKASKKEKDALQPVDAVSKTSNKMSSKSSIPIDDDDEDALLDENLPELQEIIKSKLPPTDTPSQSTAVATENDHPSPVKAGSKSAPLSKAKVPSVEIEANKGTERYKDLPSWEHLLVVETLEQDDSSSAGYRWFIRWNEVVDPNGNAEQTWVSNKTAKAKFPQRVIKFYEDHLKFKTSPDENDGDDLDGDITMPDGE